MTRMMAWRNPLEIQKVEFARFPSNTSNSGHSRSFENGLIEKRDTGGPKIFIGTVQCLLFPRHNCENALRKDT